MFSHLCSGPILATCHIIAGQLFLPGVLSLHSNCACFSCLNSSKLVFLDYKNQDVKMDYVLKKSRTKFLVFLFSHITVEVNAT
jgi:hypothetical protein